MGSVLATQDGLTDMQSRFADEYPIDFNATRAAERAGYGSPSRRGWELTRNAKVAAVIRERGGVTAADVGLSRRYLLTKAKEILERTLMDVMYEIPSDESVKEIIVNKDVILQESEPIFVGESEAESA